MTGTYAHHFVTLDKMPTPSGDSDVRFNLIESEDGGTYWAYGHVLREDFIAELDRWLEHVGVEPTTEDMPIDHMWAKYDDSGDFILTESGDREAFPVTRGWL